MIKIAVCDDNSILLKKYERMMYEVCKNEPLGVHLETFGNGLSLLEKIKENREAFDIIFLDILMDPLNGVETAKQLREAKSKAIIIFLTSSEEYVFDTVGIKAMCYLMKDELTLNKLENVCKEAIEKAKERLQNVFVISKDDGEHNMAFQDICFIKTYKGYHYIHHWDGMIFENNDMDVLEKLKDKGFYLVHPQYTIGLRYISSIERDKVILTDKSHNVIPLDKKNVAGLKLAFADFMMKEM